MLFKVELSEIRPIRSLTFEVDLARHGLICLVGKNGAGKTTLAKAILNFILADTFSRTSSDGIFQQESTIRYSWGEQEFVFTYDQAIRSLNSNTPIPQAIKNQIAVELPVPYGNRFNFFRTLSESDNEIRRAVILGDYRPPKELIEFLSRIYEDTRFANLVEVSLKTGVCCCFIAPDGRYVREDYFSSGEYFLINLYRKILQGNKLLVIDEIDISLDATAQARLAGELRALCTEHAVNLVFTSHSLAMMQTMEPGEILYIERGTEKAVLTPISFGYAKSLMFGFKGYDKYILTEDKVLKDFLEYVIARYCPPSFFRYVIIYAGGATEVVDMMDRNEQQGFLSASRDLISVLDGDQQEMLHSQKTGVYCIPLWNVEQGVWDESQKTDFPYRLPVASTPVTIKPKGFYKSIIKQKVCSQAEIFNLLCNNHSETLRQFAKQIEAFLCRSTSTAGSLVEVLN